MFEKQTYPWRRFFIFVSVGVFVGFTFLHPIAMLISTCQDSTVRFNWKIMRTAFSLDHFPMAIFFMLLGAFVGMIYSIINARLEKYIQKLQLIEEILPMCRVCKKIRHEDFKQKKVEWLSIENYISDESHARIRHDYCPECYEKAKW